MSEPPQSRSATPIITPTRVVAGILLVIPFVAMLWVSSYAKLTPSMIGIPFFYWYQMAWVLISTALTSLAYVLIRREERVRKAARQGDAR